MKRPPPKGTPRRLRRTAQEARAAILDVAERQLVELGPAGIRLQQVAAEVGVSHSTVLHHFGSREALLSALVTRSIARLHADLVDAIGRAPQGKEQVAGMLDRVATAFEEGGHGRALAWLALSGLAPDPGLRLREVAEAAHALRRHRRGTRTPSFEDTLFAVLLAAFALFAQSVAGPNLARSAGLTDERAAERFRRWLAQLLVEHLRHGG